MSFEVLVCGPRGSFPIFGKNYEKYGQATSCYLIKDGDYAIILDCGSGFINAARLCADCSKIDIMLSHVHYDHIMGLFDFPEMLDPAKIDYYGNFTEWEKFENQNGAKSVLYSIKKLARGKTHPIIIDREFPLSHGFSASFTESIHGEGACMISISKEDKRLCFTGDYEHDNGIKIVHWARECDLLIFDGSYNSNEYPKFKGWGHSAWESGCRIARQANVKKLLITHHAPQHDDEFMSKQEALARELFPMTYFAAQGKTYSV